MEAPDSHEELHREQLSKSTLLNDSLSEFCPTPSLNNSADFAWIEESLVGKAGDVKQETFEMDQNAQLQFNYRDNPFVPTANDIKASMPMGLSNALNFRKLTIAPRDLQYPTPSPEMAYPPDFSVHDMDYGIADAECDEPYFPYVQTEGRAFTTPQLPSQARDFDSLAKTMKWPSNSLEYGQLVPACKEEKLVADVQTKEYDEAHQTGFASRRPSLAVMTGSSKGYQGSDFDPDLQPWPSSSSLGVLSPITPLQEQQPFRAAPPSLQTTQFGNDDLSGLHEAIYQMPGDPYAPLNSFADCQLFDDVRSRRVFPSMTNYPLPQRRQSYHLQPQHYRQNPLNQQNQHQQFGLRHQDYLDPKPPAHQNLRWQPIDTQYGKQSSDAASNDKAIGLPKNDGVPPSNFRLRPDGWRHTICVPTPAGTPTITSPKPIYFSSPHYGFPESHLPATSSISSLPSVAVSQGRRPRSASSPTCRPATFVCDHPDCGKVFTRSSNLKSHQRIHADTRPYVCTICSATFRRSHDCTRHEKKHSDVRPYPCPVCGRRFTRQDALKRHVMVHTSNRGFQAAPSFLPNQEQRLPIVAIPAQQQMQHQNDKHPSQQHEQQQENQRLEQFHLQQQQQLQLPNLQQERLQPRQLQNPHIQQQQQQQQQEQPPVHSQQHEQQQKQQQQPHDQQQHDQRPFKTEQQPRMLPTVMETPVTSTETSPSIQ